MKFFRTTYGGNSVGRTSSRALAALICRAKAGSSGASPHRTLPQSAFTMVEVAISLAIIGIALVAIIGVLPLGMNVQRDNREATVINQDASVFLEAIRTGSRSLDDLTNYVYAITNTWMKFGPNGVVQNINADGYSFKGSQITKLTAPPFFPLTNGLRIIGLLSTPELTDLEFNPTNNLISGGYSNHVVTYVRSISGPAVEKPPQDNQIIQSDAFTYFIYCVNAPVAMNFPPGWQAKSYNVGDQVFYNSTIWQATATTAPGDIPDSGQVPTPWMHNSYLNQLSGNLHELRLTFLWPVRPNGKLGNGRQTYRALVAGQIMQTNSLNQPLYFYQSQSFTNAP
jgi:prepilin-type N-terminal cleavage/methylation domain-containing protein